MGPPPSGRHGYATFGTVLFYCALGEFRFII